MKKFLCIALAVLLLVPFAGCSRQETDIQDPVAFYYRKSKTAYSGVDGVIAKEIRDAQGKTGDPAALVSQYLRGPESQELSQTFPKDVTLVSLWTDDSTTHIVLSDDFSALTGLDLTIACACLTMTVCELTGTASMRVRTENTLLDGIRSITVNRDDIVLLDESDIIIEPD